MDSENSKLLMGNEAMGRGLVEAGCRLVAAYPGTPSSEILGAVVANMGTEDHDPLHVEWSVNEKIAYEVALAASYTGKRSAVIMKQVGLNVAADPFTRSTYIGTKGGFVVIVADDPGPHSSQTEQDTRLFGLFAKAPVFDPASPAEAGEMIEDAFRLSEQYEIPVILRPTTRICHSRQNIAIGPVPKKGVAAEFEKNPGRWVATPAFLTGLHNDLNAKLADIGGRKESYPVRHHGDGSTKTCVIASGMAFANTSDLFAELELSEKGDLYQVQLPFPLNSDFISDINEKYDKVLVLEETYSVIELQLANRAVQGRGDNTVPGCGELVPDVIHDILVGFFDIALEAEPPVPAARGRRPSLCPGCPHRASFFAIKSTFSKKGIFPSDIGCYTLGVNLGAVDTCHCMGACISQGAGFYHSYAQDNDDFPTVVVTIGDSTFFHAGIPALINAVTQKARIIVTILDNSTTAMTGQQPTPQTGVLADGGPGNQVFIPDIVQACGVKFFKECDPYDIPGTQELLKEADSFIRSDEGGVAVILAKHPCLMDKRNIIQQPRFKMEISDDCIGCGICTTKFECPAILLDEEEKQAWIDQDLCCGCGVCDVVCPTGSILKVEDN
ncbi:MAG: thiamine pyrophosphate-dependent enzyme [Thermodesulfobacteriota bacterium]